MMFVTVRLSNSRFRGLNGSEDKGSARMQTSPLTNSSPKKLNRHDESAF